ncbi:MAG: alpha-amylase family glycosyl hydrolase, partial [Planctomycetota bacterium]
MQAKPLISHASGHVTAPVERSECATDFCAAHDTPDFHTPDWARHAIWYQILLDRFRNGNPGNDPKPVRPWTSHWFWLAPWERRGRGFHAAAFHRHYGGDLAGLESRLPYLRDLGINALYLNPVFKASTFHKYNATNYLHIDDHFGRLGDYESAVVHEDLLDPETWTWTDTDRQFLRFLAAAREMGIRVVIDGVFNHVGTQHPAFQDIKARGRSSPFADWFEVSSWQPFSYKGWWDHPELPVFKKSPTGFASEAVKEHIFAVTRRWMAPEGDPSAGVAGWRLDVPNEIAPPFWAQWRELVKSINPQAYISGEIWGRATQWLDGRH